MASVGWRPNAIRAGVRKITVDTTKKRLKGRRLARKFYIWSKQEV